MSLFDALCDARTMGQTMTQNGMSLMRDLYGGRASHASIYGLCFAHYEQRLRRSSNNAESALKQCPIGLQTKAPNGPIGGIIGTRIDLFFDLKPPLNKYLPPRRVKSLGRLSMHIIFFQSLFDLTSLATFDRY